MIRAYFFTFVIVFLTVVKVFNARLVIEDAIEKKRIVRKPAPGATGICIEKGHCYYSSMHDVEEAYWICESVNERILLETTSGKHVCLGEENVTNVAMDITSEA